MRKIRIVILAIALSTGTLYSQSLFPDGIHLKGEAPPELNEGIPIRIQTAAEIRIPSRLGYDYTVWRSDTVDGRYFFFSLKIPGTGSDMSFWVKPENQGFFRVDEQKNSSFVPIVTFTEPFGIKTVPVNPGLFPFGAVPGEADAREDEQPMTATTLTYSYSISQFEITRRQWKAVFPDSPFGEDSDFPVTKVPHRLAEAFCEALGPVQDLEGYVYRLPTEEEWEKACRGGTVSRYYWGDDLDGSQIDDYAWHAGNSGRQVQKVGQKLPNALGIYDMLGNAEEWTASGKTPHLGGSVTNSFSGPNTTAAGRPLAATKGGSADDLRTSLRSAFRQSSVLDIPDVDVRDDMGFRIVVSVQLPGTTE